MFSIFTLHSVRGKLIVKVWHNVMIIFNICNKIFFCSLLILITGMIGIVKLQLIIYVKHLVLMSKQGPIFDVYLFLEQYIDIFLQKTTNVFYFIQKYYKKIISWYLPKWTENFYTWKKLRYYYVTLTKNQSYAHYSLTQYLVKHLPFFLDALSINREIIYMNYQPLL